MKDLVHGSSCKSQSLKCTLQQGLEVSVYWKHGSANDSTEWVPCSVIKPIPEVVESFLGEKLSDAVVEVGIEFVNDAFVFDNREEANAEGETADRTERGACEESVELFVHDDAD